MSVTTLNADLFKNNSNEYFGLFDRYITEVLKEDPGTVNFDNGSGLFFHEGTPYKINVKLIKDPNNTDIPLEDAFSQVRMSDDSPKNSNEKLNGKSIFTYQDVTSEDMKKIGEAILKKLPKGKLTDIAYQISGNSPLMEEINRLTDIFGPGATISFEIGNGIFKKFEESYSSHIKRFLEETVKASTIGNETPISCIFDVRVNIQPTKPIYNFSLGNKTLIPFLEKIRQSLLDTYIVNTFKNTDAEEILYRVVLSVPSEKNDQIGYLKNEINARDVKAVFRLQAKRAPATTGDDFKASVGDILDYAKGDYLNNLGPKVAKPAWAK